MPRVSQKGENMPSSPIRKLVPYSDAAKQKGIKVYHLNIGQPDIETPPLAMKVLQDKKIDVLEYSHSAGMLSFRKKLVEYYGRFGIDITPE